MPLGKLLSLFKPQVPHLENGHSGITLIELQGSAQYVRVKIYDVTWVLGKDLYK